MQLGIVSLILVLIAKYSQASVDDSTCNTIEIKDGTLVRYNPCMPLRDASGPIKTHQCSTPQLADGKQCIKNEQYKDSPVYPCLRMNLDFGNGIKKDLEACGVKKTTDDSSSVEGWIPCECEYNPKECNQDVYGFSNTMCVYKNEPQPACGEVLREGLSEAEELKIVGLHNELRALVASGKENGGFGGPQPQASNMRKLEWNDDLAAAAQRLAYQCFHKVTKQLMNDYNRGVKPWAGKVKVQDDNLVGQNLGYFLHAQEKNTSVVLDLIIRDQWYSQLSTLGPYYTQLVWADTEAVGCGFVTTKDVAFKDGTEKMTWMGAKDWVESVLVCNYGPTGNVKSTASKSSLIYKQGQPGTECPVGTQASQSGLCEKSNGK